MNSDFSIALRFGRTVAVIRAIFSLPEWPFKGVLSFWSYMMNTTQLPYFTNIVCQTGYHFSLVIPRHWFPFRLFTCCCHWSLYHWDAVYYPFLWIAFITHVSAFTFMLLKNRHWNFHWRNISSFKEHLLRKLTLMTEPKCNGTSRTRYIFLVTDFSLISPI